MSDKKDKRELCYESLTLARKYKSDRKLARSFAHYLVHWQLSKLASASTESCDLGEIMQVFDELTLKLEEDKRVDDLLSTYQQAFEIFPKNEDIEFRFANKLFMQGNSLKALQILSKSQGLKSKELAEVIKSHALDRWHFAMLNDNTRNEAYYKALTSSVRSNDIVLDIGTGSGILSMFASRANPRKIIACEASKDLAKLANDVFKANGLSQIELHNKISTHVSLEEKADILVTETFDAGLFGEHVLEILDHAHKHLLKSQCE